MTLAFDSFLTLAKGRQSVREFAQAPVDDESIERLLRAACLAPSAHNRQPWRFVVVRDAQRRAALANAMAERQKEHFRVSYFVEQAPRRRSRPMSPGHGAG